MLLLLLKDYNDETNVSYKLRFVPLEVNDSGSKESNVDIQLISI
jgi:hypothetical protein